MLIFNTSLLRWKRHYNPPMAKGGLLSLLLVSSGLCAHDLYLVTGVKGAEGKVCARVGENFPESLNAVSADRLELFQARGESVRGAAIDGVSLLKGQKEEGNQFCAALPPEWAGLVEMIVHPRYIKLEAKDFNSYVAAENFRTVARLRKQRGETEKPGRELYSRYAKLIMGNAGATATQTVGHHLEILPLKNPSELKPKEPLLVQVVFAGKPLANVRVGASYAGAATKGHEYPVTGETDAQGRATLKLDRSGLWYARLIHMIPAKGDPEFDWRSFFATLTFTVPE